jgi:nitrilase
MIRTMRVQAAVVQAAPIGFDREQTMAKLEGLIAEAARGGAELTVFPEAFVPGYPRGIDFGAVVGRRMSEGRDQFRRYSDGAIIVPGPDVDRIATAAREHAIHIVVGVVERDGGRSTAPRSSSARRVTWASIAS